ncbi:MAG: hypothetical protein KF768_08840 [Phycisphaeraceae bacterium]|nr:hypothetical protein [Phycisphaeraceae bacterium]
MSLSRVSGGHTRRMIDRLIPFAALGAVVLAVGHAGLSSSSSSVGAQPRNEPRGEPLTTTPFNAGEQRRLMIEQMRDMNQRLARLESRLNQPLEVRVKEMPPITLPPQQPPN